MRKAFLIVYDNNVLLKSLQIKKLHDDLIKDPDVLGWWHHISNTYIIITSNSPSVVTVREFVQERMPNTHFLVMEVNYNNYDGFLPQTSWDWFEKSLKSV